MAFEIIIPRLGWSMEEGVFSGWLKKDGDTIRQGDPLFELEGEKAIQEIEAIDAGILRFSANSPQPGNVVKAGTVVGYLIAEGESVNRMCDPPREVPRSRIIKIAGEQRLPLTSRRRVIAQRMVACLSPSCLTRHSCR